MGKPKIKEAAKKFWWFIWESNSIWSWLANIVLAFVIIYFIVYPGLGFLLGTSHPIVAVMSGSMEHRTAKDQNGNFWMCNQTFEKKQSADFDFWWSVCGEWYETNLGITKSQFEEFGLSNGFNKGEIIVLKGIHPEEIKIGDVIVFQSYSRQEPIIHRVVNKWQEDEEYYFTTKGDHNKQSYQFEARISESQYIGGALLRVPYLGWVKIIFVNHPVWFILVSFVVIVLFSYSDEIRRYLKR